MWAAESRYGRRFFAVVPPILLLCYVPAIFGSLEILPRQSDAYDWMAQYLLPFGLFLLVVTTDIPAIFRLGWPVLVVMLVGSAGVMAGAILSYYLVRSFLPTDAWTVFVAITGSWIGGGSNFAALREAVAMPDRLTGPAIVVDATVGYIWLGIVLFMARHQDWVRRFYEPRELESHVDDATAEVEQSPVSAEQLVILIAVALPVAVGCMWAGSALFSAISDTLHTMPAMQGVLSAYTFGILAVTLSAILLSFTPLRKLERFGATPVGYATQFIFFTSLGAQADIAAILELPVLLLAGILWIGVHILFLAIISRALRTPLYVPAIASIANVSGPSVAAIVGAEYGKNLAALGLLLGLLGNLLGTWAGLGIALLFRFVG